MLLKFYNNKSNSNHNKNSNNNNNKKSPEEKTRGFKSGDRAAHVYSPSGPIQ